MITNYNIFISEEVKSRKAMEWDKLFNMGDPYSQYTEKDPEFYQITKYKWNDGKLDVYQNVNLYEYKLKKLPFPFGKINGDFNIIKNPGLSDLENCPHTVTGEFHCSENIKLKSMDGCPTYVGKNFVWVPKPLKDFTIADYPMYIIGKHIHPVLNFQKILKIVREHTDMFIPLLGNKVRFHQQVMRIDPYMIPLYENTGINPPSTRTII